jgi:hypothetical protein
MSSPQTAMADRDPIRDGACPLPPTTTSPAAHDRTEHPGRQGTPVQETVLLPVASAVCPVERALREVAALYREVDHVPTSGDVHEDAADPERRAILKDLYDKIEAGEARAARSIALTPVGAAFQALLLFQHVEFGPMDTPKKLNEAERSALYDAGRGVRATGLSLYRLMSRVVKDDDLAVVHQRILSDDSYADLFEQIGVDVLKNL